MAAFTDAIGLDRYAIYIFDYGAPVGLRLAMARPGAITAIISQNGNAYEEGLSEGWAQTRTYWADPSPVNRDAMRGMFSLEAIRWQYTHGTPDETQVAPEGYWLDYAPDLASGHCRNSAGSDRRLPEQCRALPAHPPVFPRTPATASWPIWGDKDPFFLPAERGGLPEGSAQGGDRLPRHGSLRTRNAWPRDHRPHP
ncbi:alpha/beta fold hydrolase [Caulobacter segnis]